MPPSRFTPPDDPVSGEKIVALIIILVLAVALLTALLERGT